MRTTILIASAAILASIALTSPVQAASEAEKAQAIGALLAQVCLPILEDGRNESDVTRAAGLRPVHQVWFPQSPPPGLRQYASSYAGVKVVNLTNDTCSLHVDAVDFPNLEAEVLRVLDTRGESWSPAPSPTSDGQQHIFCDPAGRVAVRTFEGDPTRFPAFKALQRAPSFEVRVKWIDPACAVQPSEGRGS